MWCNGNELNNLEDNSMSMMMVNKCKDEAVSISMDDCQRSSILDELSAWLVTFPFVCVRLALIFYRMCTTGPLFPFIPDLSLISILSSYVLLCPRHLSFLFCTDFPTHTFHSISDSLMTPLHCYCHASLSSPANDVFSLATLTCYPTLPTCTFSWHWRVYLLCYDSIFTLLV